MVLELLRVEDGGDLGGVGGEVLESCSRSQSKARSLRVRALEVRFGDCVDIASPCLSVELLFGWVVPPPRPSGTRPELP